MKILFPVDGSSHCTRAARYLAKHWPNADTLTLLNVDAPLQEYVSARLDAASIARFHAENGKAALRNVHRILIRAGRACEERLLLGDPATQIVTLAHDGHYDLIVMGSHGRSVIKSLFLGSVVIKVLTSSRIPVLVVR